MGNCISTTHLLYFNQGGDNCFVSDTINTYHHFIPLDHPWLPRRGKVGDNGPPCGKPDARLTEAHHHRYEYNTRLSTMMVTVLHGYEVTPPQLSTLMVSVSKLTWPPPKALMVSETEQLPPPGITHTQESLWTIDHFMVTPNLSDFIIKYETLDTVRKRTLTLNIFRQWKEPSFPQFHGQRV